MTNRIKNRTGEKFGSLTVIEFVFVKKNRAYWLCKCKCGKDFITSGELLRSGHVKSCGCKRKGINKGEKNGLWKGDDVGYQSLHAWVYRNLPKPKLCQICGKSKKLDAANISQEYKRDINDWKWICRSCHMMDDGRMNNLKNQNILVCKNCGGKLSPDSNSYKYQECDTCFWAEGFSSPATIINKRFGFKR